MTAGPFQVMPALTDAEYAELRDSIARDGITVPVVYDQHGRLIDGHHRVRIAADLGVDVPQVVREVANAQEARSLAYSLNLHRRHLSREQKRDLLATSIKADPGLSDREHAARVGASKNTAAAVREELVAGGQVDHLTERTGADGKTYPAHVTTTTRTSEATKVEHDVDLDTGEIVDPAYAAGVAAADAVDLPDLPLGPSLMSRFLGSVTRAWDVTRYDPESVAAAADAQQWSAFVDLVDSLARWRSQAEAARPSHLRIIGGAK